MIINYMSTPTTNLKSPSNNGNGRMQRSLNPTGRITLLLAQNRVKGEGVSQIEQLAVASDVPRDKIHAFNSGKATHIRVEHLHSLAKSFELESLALLLGMDEDVHTAVSRLIPKPITASRPDQSIRSLSAELGISRPSLTKFDNGTAVVVNLDHVALICEALQINANHLLRYCPNCPTETE